jgi:hypothetical protein
MVATPVVWAVVPTVCYPQALDTRATRDGIDWLEISAFERGL